MNTLSSLESDDRQADLLRDLISRHAAALAAATFGSQFALDGAVFRLYARGRNTIYTVRTSTDWFVKLPREGPGSAIDHERLGAEVITRALCGNAEYVGASSIRISSNPAFVLTARIPGRPLNRLVFSRGWLPGRRSTIRLRDTFAMLGRLLGALHRQGRLTGDALDASTRPFDTLRHMLRRHRGLDPIVEQLKAWMDGAHYSDVGPVFIHGNFRMDNILKAPTGLGFIDFENCGLGSPYQDLSRPITELLLTRCIIGFPRLRVMQCATAFVQSYSGLFPYQPQALWPFVQARLGRYYLESLKPTLLPPRVGGIPVSRRLLKGVMRAAWAEPLESIAPEIVE